jgi:hypothetical protein
MIRPGSRSRLTTTSSRRLGPARRRSKRRRLARGVGLGVVRLRHGPEHLLEVRPQLRMVFDDLVLLDPLRQHHGAAIGLGEPSEQMLIGGHAERLINAPDDHPIEEALCPAM